MIKENEVYKIGRIGKPHGISGEVTLRFSDDVFDRVDADYLVLMVDGILVPFFIEEYRFRSDEVALVKFEDIDTMDRAAELTGCDVFFPRHLADIDNDEAVSDFAALFVKAQRFLVESQRLFQIGYIVVFVVHLEFHNLQCQL